MPLGIAETVKALVVLADAKADIVEKIDRLQDVHADDRVLLQGEHLGHGEIFFLVQQRQVDADLADVVQDGRALQDLEPFG